jgi:murein endopeptidase
LPPLVFFAIAAANAGMLGPWLDDDPASTGFDTGAPEIPYADPPMCIPGGLRGAVQLPPADDLYIRATTDRMWGTSYMIDLLGYEAETMAIRMPEADRILMGDISTRYGGALPPHKSHQQGIDADVGIYVLDADGVPHQGVMETGFLHATPATLDYPDDWLMIKTFLDTGRVQMILLDQHLIDGMRTYLLENAILTRPEVDRIFPPPGTPHMWEMDGIVRHADRHDDHMHVRVKCATE